MAAIRVKDDDEEVQPEPKEETHQEETHEEETQEEPQDDTQEETQEEGKEELPMLPSGHRRAALARGFTTEEVDQYLRTKPDEANQYFGEVFDNWQKDNSEWSRRGRDLKAAETQRSSAPTGEPAVKGTKIPEAIPMVDAKALAEEHGFDEALIGALVGPINATATQLNAIATKFAGSEEFIKKTESDTLAANIQTFFTSDDMKSLGETYGLDDAALTTEQFDKRMEVLGEADIIIAGARDHGIDMSTQDALSRAYSIVSKGSRDDILRQEIRDSMKKRTKTLPSSHQQTPTRDTDKPMTDDELVKSVQSKMDELKYGT